MKKLLWVSIFMLLAALPARAEEGATLEALRHAALLGNTDAQLELGMLYEFGYNMAKNTASALAWYSVAAEQGNALAVKRRDLLAGRLTSEEVEEAHRQSAEILAKKSAPVATPTPAAPVIATEPPKANTAAVP